MGLKRKKETLMGQQQQQNLQSFFSFSMAKREADFLNCAVAVFRSCCFLWILFLPFLLLILACCCFWVAVQPPPTFPLTYANADTLLVGMSLPQGVPLRSNNSAYYLVVQGDGNLVLYTSPHFSR